MISALVLAGLWIPWFLQDPNYRDLDKIPMVIEPLRGLDVAASSKLIARQGKPGPNGDLYLAQYTFVIENRRKRTARGVRLHLRGVDANHNTLFVAKSKPLVLDIDAGGTAKAFLRAKNLTQGTVRKLRKMIITVKSTTPAGPR